MDVNTIKSALAIQCLPMGMTERKTIWGTVEKAIAAIDASGLSYTVSPFETVVEGPLDKLFEVAAAAHKALLVAGAPTAATYMKLWSGDDLGSSDEKTGKFRKAGH